METQPPGPDFSFLPIDRLHDDRARRIREIIRQATTPAGSAAAFSAADYCLAHHVLEGAEAAARAADAKSFAWYRGRPDAGAAVHAVQTAAGPRVVVSPSLSEMPWSGISETPHYVLSAATTGAPRPLLALAADAFAIGTRAGFGGLLSAHAVVVCLLRRKDLGEPLDSWTITRLPGTVFCDYTGHPAVLGRDLVHEAAHNWLNDAITATNCLSGEDVKFFSPWKGTMRPAYGFLHACWAFPLMMLYTARVLDEDDGGAAEAKAFLATYLDKQRRLLASAARDHEAALALIGDPGLRQRLHAARQQAAAL